MTTDYLKYAKTAELAGKILLESRAESYRVEDTTRRFLLESGLPIAEVSTDGTALYITLANPEAGMLPITMVTRVTRFSNKLGRIYKVNHISRQLTQKKIDIDEAYEQLKQVRASKYREHNKDFANVLLVISFSLILGGGIPEMLMSIFAGLILVLSRHLHKLLGLHPFIRGVATTFAVAFLMQTLAYWFGGFFSAELVISATLIPLYPGTLITNGMRDMLKGDYISGISFVTVAIVTAVSLAIGVASGLYFYREMIR